MSLNTKKSFTMSLWPLPQCLGINIIRKGSPLLHHRAAPFVFEFGTYLGMDIVHLVYHCCEEKVTPKLRLVCLANHLSYSCTSWKILQASWYHSSRASFLLLESRRGPSSLLLWRNTGILGAYSTTVSPLEIDVVHVLWWGNRRVDVKHATLPRPGWKAVTHIQRLSVFS